MGSRPSFDEIHSGPWSSSKGICRAGNSVVTALAASVRQPGCCLAPRRATVLGKGWEEEGPRGAGYSTELQGNRSAHKPAWTGTQAGGRPWKFPACGRALLRGVWPCHSHVVNRKVSEHVRQPAVCYQSGDPGVWPHTLKFSLVMLDLKPVSICPAFSPCFKFCFICFQGKSLHFFACFS